MTTEPKEPLGAASMTAVGFLDEFLRRHQLLPELPFCWVLGSGASVQSKIRTGTQLVSQWLSELHQQNDSENRSLEEWATEDNLQIKGFTFASRSRFYPQIYQRRFAGFRDLGYAFLEHAMDSAEPSFGYSALAQIMATTRHKVAVTTNFDNLIADAISIYARVSSLVCGHEALSGFIRPNISRPVIAKIHRDLLLNPKSEPEEIERLPPEWESALNIIFTHSTPIVLGYGGNDGSLMEFFRKLSPIRGGMFWCHRINSLPEPRIQEVVRHHNGRLVPILGFDELMLQLWEKLELPSPIPELQRRHVSRLENYQTQFESLNARLKTPGHSKAEERELKQARSAAATAGGRIRESASWWPLHLRAEAESDPKKAAEIYREAMILFPNNAALAEKVALFQKQKQSR